MPALSAPGSASILKRADHERAELSRQSLAALEVWGFHAELRISLTNAAAGRSSPVPGLAARFAQAA